MAQATHWEEQSLEPLDEMFPRDGRWTRPQLKLAFHFYCQTPFGQFDSRNKKVQALSALIGRTHRGVERGHGEPTESSQRPVPVGVARPCVRHTSADRHSVFEYLYRNAGVAPCPIRRRWTPPSRSSRPASRVVRGITRGVDRQWMVVSGSRLTSLLQSRPRQSTTPCQPNRRCGGSAGCCRSGHGWPRPVSRPWMADRTGRQSPVEAPLSPKPA